MKITIELTDSLNLDLYRQVTELRAMGVKTSKAKLIEKLIEVGLKSERV